MSYGLREYEQESTVLEHRRALGRIRWERWRKMHGAAPSTHRFLGVDGEGAGKDAEGRQNYLLLRAGERRELFNGNKRLSTEECLEFLLGMPRSRIAVGYFFTYDATQILRDLNPERLAKLFEPKERGPGFSPYTYWGEYAIDFRPRQYFRVARLKSRNTTEIVPHSSRTVNEVGQFFQGPFVKQLIDWEICSAEDLAKIAAGKEDRGNENRLIITPTEREYCGLEVHYLENLMEKFREVCTDTGMVPHVWRGPGAIAAVLHGNNGTPKRKDIERPKRLEMRATEAYFGGRFEVAQVGRIPGPVYEYDINSAYPAGMLSCPCPKHTKWKRFDGPPPDRSGLYVAGVVFDHPHHPALCNLPIRTKGRLTWPEKGIGSYWSVEIEAAIAAGTEVIAWQGGYQAVTKCDCLVFDWVRELYEYRRQVGKSQRGIALKLGINSLYGKLCQRIGTAPWRDLVAGGLITAHCRANLIRAYAGNEDKVVMLATDALFSKAPLNLPLTEYLGDWEELLRPTGVFIVQPGVYWSPGSDIKPKTRGVPRSNIIAQRDLFEARWDRWVRGDDEAAVPSVVIKLKSFIGHRLALHRNKPELAGAWVQNNKEIRFDWSSKRQWTGLTEQGYMRTLPKPGSFGADGESQPYDPALLSDLAAQIMEFEAMDDYVPLGNTDE
jgi:hypothetical protein